MTLANATFLMDVACLAHKHDFGRCRNDAIEMSSVSQIDYLTSGAG
jgi:hypothetical protein